MWSNLSTIKNLADFVMSTLYMCDMIQKIIVVFFCRIYVFLKIKYYLCSRNMCIK